MIPHCHVECFMNIFAQTIPLFMCGIGLNPFPNAKFGLNLQTIIQNLMKFDENGRKFSKQVENTGKKEKLLVTSNFSYSLSVFKRLVLQTRKNQGLFGKGLRKNG